MQNKLWLIAMNIEKFKAKLAAQHEDLVKQLKEVKKKYPLVVLAYAVQEATIVELTTAEAKPATITDICSALTPSRAANEYVRLLSDLRHCLERSKDYEGGMACFETFHERRQHPSKGPPP